MAWILSGFADEAAGDIDGQIQACKRGDLRQLDLRNVNGHNITQLPLDLAREVAGKLQSAEIRVGMVGSPLGKIDIVDDFQTDLAKLEHLGRLKNILNCNAVRIFSYYNRTKQPIDAWRTESLRRLQQLKDLSRKLGLILYHENEREIYGDAVEHVEAIAAALRDAAGFRMIFDFDNYNQGGQDVWAAWLRLRGMTDAFHLKDSDARKQHVPVGQGVGRVRDILADAKKRNWTGVLRLEPHLTHSAAVMATGPGGTANQALKDLPPAESFQAAVVAAKDLLQGLGARVE